LVPFCQTIFLDLLHILYGACEPQEVEKHMRFKNPDTRNLKMKKLRNQEKYVLVDKGILRWREARKLECEKAILEGRMDPEDWRASGQAIRKRRKSFPGAPLSQQERFDRERRGLLPPKITKLFE
jgi:hypothetical protein